MASAEPPVRSSTLSIIRLPVWVRLSLVSLASVALSGVFLLVCTMTIFPLDAGMSTRHAHRLVARAARYSTNKM
jgi:hypothetical protein